MKKFIRNCCVICNNKNLISFSEFEHPYYQCVSLDKTNKSWTIKYGYCEECYSVQLMNLADPEILYDKNYFQPLNNTYLWIQHNISFTKFIIDNLNTDINNSIIEIGSSSFCLGKHLINYFTDYTVFDYSIKQAIKRDDVVYIEGNCENYNFNKDSNIVMSHVFEHLYEPKLFIQNCYKNKVKNIFIAIPSMNDANQLYINDQHTFTYNQNDIEYIFGQFNYKLNNFTLWNSNDLSFNCLFFHFVLTDNNIIIDRIFDKSRNMYTLNFLTNKITIPKNTFIATCAIITYSLIVNKEDIIGIIDIDKNKQGKKFSTTDIIVYPYEHLKNFDYNTSILIDHPKKKNIIECIKNVNQNINIILL
jgi:hypothetical protein